MVWRAIFSLYVWESRCNSWTSVSRLQISITRTIFVSNNQRTQNGEMWYKLNEIEVPIWIECDISLGHFVNPFGVAHTSVQIFMLLFFPFLCAFFLRTKNMNRCTFDEYSAWCMYDSCMKYEIDASKWKIKVMRTIYRNSLSIGRNGMYPLRSN